MALDRIEKLIDKYFEGETSIAEENELKTYFSSLDVAQHLQQYKPVFGYFSQAKAEEFKAEIPLNTKKRNVAVWLSIAASFVIMLGVGTFMYLNTIEEIPSTATAYGTYDDPEKALAETEKALALVSEHLNTGIESVSYINEYQNSKNKIFKK
ncbi:hypothetical protein [Flavobacterium aquatile]|uniref:Uncharacterized protein n=1 Tax=Flavobacterium aquatile LMG 4008 = ATCC 11947 TaxID=1453498 RepID=A0A095SZ95_9FLAO|nr:hypothetical protein [Flavobacterium aquatile]KGD69689.1 hypothetical protein LG45_02725 [Flavobacterium aquatile LMG 4008 = ATCC 11947]OXA67174.1 hypothetical protein B0A61_08165 [Flavobacterium aquatile LMG 4008 = ATCC 11947]GEC77829.1 hypothetical protein FAQ01_06990 [Flavobacterium aquatile]